MLTVPVVDETSRIERMQASLRALVEKMQATRAGFPQALQGEIGSSHDDLVRFGTRRRQPPGCTARTDRNRRRHSDRAEAHTTDEHGVPCLRLRPFGATQRDIARRALSVTNSFSNATLLSIAGLLLCLGAVVAIFLYVRRAVIQRLKSLQRYMRAQVEGRPATISTAGRTRSPRWRRRHNSS